MNKHQTPNTKHQRVLPCFLALALLAPLLTLPVAFTGCKAPRLEAGGVYAPTNATGQVVYNDLGLPLADASYKFAYETTLAVFAFERDNRAAIWAISPDVKHALDKARPQVVAIDLRWAQARHLYRAHPTPAGLTTLQTILAEINRLVPIVQAQLAPMNQALLAQPQ